MDKKLTDLLEELELLGINNDNAAADYESKYLNLEKEAAEFISFLIKVKQAEKVLKQVEKSIGSVQ